jgi:hypothetical protein
MRAASAFDNRLTVTMLARLKLNPWVRRTKARIGVQRALSRRRGMRQRNDEDYEEQGEQTCPIGFKSIDRSILALGPQTRSPTLAHMNSSTGKYKHAIGTRSKSNERSKPFLLFLMPKRWEGGEPTTKAHGSER